MSFEKPELKRTDTEQVVIDDPPKEVSAEELELLDMKEKAMKCKIIALESLGHNPLSNPTNMNKRDKKKVLDIMTKWFHTKSDEEIQDEFNDIVLCKVLNETDDYTKYGVENNRVGQPLVPDDMVVYDVAGNTLTGEEMNKEIRESNDKIFNN
jgi:hypothetical protein